MKYKHASSITIIRYVLSGFALLVFSTASAQSNQPNFLIGKWRSVNKKDSLNLNFLNSREVNIDAMEKLKNQKYTYSIDTLKKQLILVMHPEGSNFQVKLLLWKLSNDEIRLQGVDFQNYDNPLLDIPKASEKNTFILRRAGEL
jgi:hypothetical protein